MAEQNDVHELLYGNYDNHIYHNIREKKEKEINNFVKANESAPLQRTDEWFLMRNSVIGTSELAALVGMSPYQNLESLARKKGAKATRHIRTHHAGGGRYSKM